MIDETTWTEAKEAFPIGSSVQGEVLTNRSFGFFVKLPGNPDAVAVVDAISYIPHGVPVDAALWPKPGQKISAEVVDHAEHNRQIKLRVGPDSTPPHDED
ncbi:RNA-binding protein [Streptomyces morookaense]|uniref:RNA-binding protein n=1 Tax=Streptomyces morookaense TaxID=1970 RepID=A0A7Y7B984_STRMO|nr:RNA-binding protein [Streptomyces morookaense]NVK81220.1 RNA-binding protein [Streptomyces morookaense]GHF30439.1 hypothetical protein GCM10010359_35680 [Streptomyces morookaense]